MFNSIQIKFENAWYFLTLILFLALTIIPYLKLSKRYRKTRNRIGSMVLHMIVSLLIVLMLVGTTFVRSEANPSNEILLLVDVSNTEEQASDERDEFIQTVINQTKFDNFKLGVVTFGFDAEYAVPFTKDYNNIYKKYKSAVSPDTSATNIANALLYAKNLFTPDSNGKIVLITDGKETDENAKSVIRSIVAGGITIDTAYIESNYDGYSEFSVTNIEYPDYHVSTNEKCQIAVTFKSNYNVPLNFTLIDNGEKDDTVEVLLKEGVQTVMFDHVFTEDGLHTISVATDTNDDLVEENNTYTSHYYLELFNKVLILEQKADASKALYEMLTKDDQYKVDVINVSTENLPLDVSKLCEYDEIIMNNIANRDLPNEFVPVLNEYVYTYGGGVFTTGGSDVDTGEAHAYSRNDMIGSLYQQMLPVQAINYTPPVGVMIIIDRSGSMGTKDESGNSLLDWARAGASSCLNALTERDYIGIMTLDSDYSTVLDLTPRTQESKIISAINTITEPTGGTVFPGAIDRAGQALRGLKNVDRRHIIIVTDGMVPASDMDIYERYAQIYYDTDGITISVVGVSMDRPYNWEELEKDSYGYDSIPQKAGYSAMLRLTKISHGRLHVISKDNTSALVSEMREDLNAPDIKEINYEDFNPNMVNITSGMFTGVDQLFTDEGNVTNQLPGILNGYYGVKARPQADIYLTGPSNVPLYAQWKYGQGMVGSFMCDLEGEWSSDFMSDASCQRFVYNAINNLTPTKNIRFNDIKLVLTEDNYTNSLSIYTNVNVEDGEMIKATLIKQGSEDVVNLNALLEDMSVANLRGKEAYTLQPLTDETAFSRCRFVIKAPGAYTIRVEKLDKDGNILGMNEIQKGLTYSEEYDTTIGNGTNYKDYLASISVVGHGTLIEDLEDPHEIVETFELVLYHTFDPRILFAILAIILFLTDIAIRKFKFKWPHEIYRDYQRIKQKGGK